MLLRLWMLRRWDDEKWGCKKAVAMHAETSKGKRTRMLVGTVTVSMVGIKRRVRG